MKWHKWPEEKPPHEGWYLQETEFPTYRFRAVYYADDSRWSVSVIRWAEIEPPEDAAKIEETR